MIYKRILSCLLVMLLMIGIPLNIFAAEATAAEPPATEVPENMEGLEPTVTEDEVSEPPETEVAETEPSETEVPESEDILMQSAYVGIEDPGDAGISLMADVYATLGTCAALDLVPKDTITLRYTDAQGGSHYTQISRISWHYVDSEENIIICLEPDKSSSNGSGHSGDNNISLEGNGGTIGKDVWYRLTANQRRAIGLVLLYGCPNDYWDSSAGVKTSGVNPNKGYRAATQAIVWEIVAGMRSPVAPYGYTSVSNAKDFWNQCSGVVEGIDGTDYFQKCYNHIVSSLAAHGTVPSFTSKASASAPTITMTGTTTTVTDTNGVLSRFDFTNTSNVTFTKSGNNLTIKSNGTVPSTTFSAYAQVPNPETSVYQLWYNGNTSEYQTLIKLYQPQSDPVPAYFKLKAATGGMKLIKTTKDSKNLAGWQFGIYSDAACTTLISGPHTTDANGEISVDGLSEGTVYVKELGHKDASVDALYECTSTNPQKVTITSGQTATVRFNNDLRTGDAKLVKQTNTGKNLNGWKIGLYYDAACTNHVSGSPFTTGTDGTITVSDLKPGTLYAKEIPTDDPYWECDTSVKEVIIVANQTATVTFTNTHYGRAKLVKKTNTGNDLSGWKIHVYTDSSCTKPVSGSPFVTATDGTITVDLLPGDYWCREVDESAQHPYWKFDTSTQKVTVKVGETASVTYTNTHYGRAMLVKKMPDGGSPAGWMFDVYRVNDQAFMGSYTSGADGTILTDLLLPGQYQVHERVPEDSLYTCETPNPQTVTIVAGATATVTFSNRLKPAEIIAYKIDLLGAPLAGAEFLLEWSEDGINWVTVAYSNSKYVTKGTCTSAGLIDGKMESGRDGVVHFTGLHPEMQYRLTETKAPEGYHLLAGPAYEGGITPDEALTVELTVVNAPVYELPMTGSTCSTIATSLQIAGAVVLLITLLYTHKKRW